MEIMKRSHPESKFQIIDNNKRLMDPLNQHQGNQRNIHNDAQGKEYVILQCQIMSEKEVVIEYITKEQNETTYCTADEMELEIATIQFDLDEARKELEEVKERCWQAKHDCAELVAYMRKKGSIWKKFGMKLTEVKMNRFKRRWKKACEYAKKQSKKRDQEQLKKRLFAVGIGRTMKGC